MIDRIFVKIIFFNNYFAAKIDVFSSPVISAVLSSLNGGSGIVVNGGGTTNEHITYDRGSLNPEALRLVYDECGTQFELFEFAYYYSEPTQQPGAGGNKAFGLSRRKRKQDNYRTYSHRYLPYGSPFQFLRFQKELSWCIVHYANQLSQLTSENNRYCYVNTTTNSSIISTSNYTLDHMKKMASRIHDIDTELYLSNNCNATTAADNDDINDNNNNNEDDTIDKIRKKTSHNKETDAASPIPATEAVFGYMKVFSNSAKISYIKSLNYKNKYNLYKHIIVYFDVAKYYQRYSSQIFRISFRNQEQIIEQSFDYQSSDVNNTSDEDEERFRELKNLLCKEVENYKPSTPSASSYQKQNV